MGDYNYTLQVILHSILELELYVHAGDCKSELLQGHLIWGCVATVACSIEVVISSLWFRWAAYKVWSAKMTS